MTIPPTMTPRNTIRSGSINEVSASSIASISSSQKSAIFSSMVSILPVASPAETMRTIIGGVFGAFFGIRTFLRSKRGKQIWDRWKLKLPVFGPLIHKICMSRFSRTFAQLIRSGVPILEVIDIVAGASGNHVVETSIKGVGEDVERGDNLSTALSKKPIFPPMMVRMVSAGEATSKIKESMMLEDPAAAIERIYAEMYARVRDVVSSSTASS